MIITPDDFSKIRSWHHRRGLVFCSGSFDLVHAAHALFFEDCKKFGSTLVVAVGSDAMISALKPDRPIMCEQVRLKMVDYLKPVDFCYLDTISTPELPLLCLDHAFANLKPNIYVVKDEAFDLSHRERLCAQYGVEMRVLKRAWMGPEAETISTTSIIEKIQGTACREKGKEDADTQKGA